MAAILLQLPLSKGTKSCSDASPHLATPHRRFLSHRKETGRPFLRRSPRTVLPLSCPVVRLKSEGEGERFTGGDRGERSRTNSLCLELLISHSVESWRDLSE